MLDQEQLTDVAWKVAVKLTNNAWLYEDMVQEAWLYYMRYHPETRSGAWNCARWAQLTLLRRDYRHRRKQQVILPEGAEPNESRSKKLIYEEEGRQEEVRSLLRQFQKEEPEAFAELKAYVERDENATGNQRVRALRARRKAERFSPAVALRD